MSPSNVQHLWLINEMIASIQTLLYPVLCLVLIIRLSKIKSHCVSPGRMKAQVLKKKMLDKTKCFHIPSFVKCALLVLMLEFISCSCRKYQPNPLKLNMTLLAQGLCQVLFRQKVTWGRRLSTSVWDNCFWLLRFFAFIDIHLKPAWVMTQETQWN